MRIMKTAVKCGKLFDSQNCKVLENQVVVVEDKTIVDVANLSEFAQETSMSTAA